MMLRDLQSGSLSLYMGDGSEEFLEKIAAAIAIARGGIEKTTFIILRTYDGCLMLTYDGCGDAGVNIIDAVHVTAGGIGEEQLLEMLDAVEESDSFVISKKSIVNALVLLEREQPDLTAKFEEVFRGSDLRKIEELR